MSSHSWLDPVRQHLQAGVAALAPSRALLSRRLAPGDWLGGRAPSAARVVLACLACVALVALAAAHAAGARASKPAPLTAGLPASQQGPAGSSTAAARRQRPPLAARPGSRAPFPWGVASAAYQVEGAVREGGRGRSIWDTFAHTPNRTARGETGDVAADFYHRWREDVALAAALGVQYFRMSIAWPRILPAGAGAVNAEGVAFYNAVFDALLAAGIEPFVTLYHWDLPQALMDRYGGWVSPDIVPDYVNYARTCFEAFGDRVRYWATFNEPIVFCFNGYAKGEHAPGWCSKRPSWEARSSTACAAGGNTTAEPYACTHNVLVAHGRAVELFRALVPGGQIGMALNTHWAEPLYDTQEDRETAANYVEYQMALFADPLHFGEWRSPIVLRKARWNPRVRAALSLAPQDRARIQGSCDFFGLNHYTTKFMSKQKPYETFERNGTLIGPRGGSDWLHVVPAGFRKLLRWVGARYAPARLWVTENGCSGPGEHEAPLPGVLQDDFRINYYKLYLAEAVAAVREDNINIVGYTAWSFTDNFEWAEGYAARFGLVYVDYATQKRYPKASAQWMADYFATSGQHPP